MFGCVTVSSERMTPPSQRAKQKGSKISHPSLSVFAPRSCVHCNQLEHAVTTRGSADGRNGPVHHAAESSTPTHPQAPRCTGEQFNRSCKPEVLPCLTSRRFSVGWTQWTASQPAASHGHRGGLLCLDVVGAWGPWGSWGSWGPGSHGMSPTRPSRFLAGGRVCHLELQRTLLVALLWGFAVSGDNRWFLLIRFGMCLFQKWAGVDILLFGR